MQAPTESLPTIDKLPSVHAADLQPAQAAIASALGSPVTVTYGSQSWTIDPADFGSYLSTQVDPTKTGAAAVSVTVDQDGLANWLQEQFEDSVDSDPVNAKVAWDGNKLKAIEDSTDGAKLRPQALAELVSASFLGNHDSVEIPVTVLKPEVDGSNLDALGITTKLGVGSSNFDGSDDAPRDQYRSGRATAQWHAHRSTRHVFVQSFDRGDRSRAWVRRGPGDRRRADRSRLWRRYLPGFDTVFRAAFFSGMPIVEGWPHRWRLGFYEMDDWTPGLDASIMQPEGDPFGGGDFRFENPSDSWMLVESYVDYPRVFVIIYGADLGYTVDVSDPVYGDTDEALSPSESVDSKLPAGTIQQTEWAAPGLDIDYYRTVTDRDGNPSCQTSGPPPFTHAAMSTA